MQRSEAGGLPQDRAEADAGAPEIPPRPPADPRSGEQRSPERSSQARARDREAHQAYKALTEALPKVPVPDDKQNPPTRRQLRRQQLERERREPAVGELQAPQGQESSGDDAGSGKPVDAGYRPQRPPIEGGRRDRRERSHAPSPNSTAGAQTSELPPAAAEAVAAGEMTMEQALAARELLIGQAKNMANVLAAQQQEDPRKVDLEVLAQQKALAERAAVLNRRAADKQRLSAEARQRRTTATDQPLKQDLASAPMEFVQIPGSEKHMLRPSITSHVPVVADKLRAAAPPGKPEKVTGPSTPLPAGPPRAAAATRTQSNAVSAAPAAPSRPAGPGRKETTGPAKAASAAPAKRDTAKQAARPAPRKPPAAEPTGPEPRSRLLAHAESVADNNIQPLRATNAHGLEPLDARTAGLGQANRLRIAVIAALALGAAAFIAGLTMMIISLSG
ncbi:hypothetical protein D477_005351 [Arthrobacter crystallopoietes BAB-32]|uniref:Uncharacterized protein n=2 Tax=Crystallibacter crystallopoietes TaxID=37928 RepID=N1VAI4_9MICC|nr:hypothetical protein D477_005351 [Arthrobacter crystallopoietes BAB-32]